MKEMEQIMQLLKDINYKKVITSRILVTGIMILLELGMLVNIFWKAVEEGHHYFNFKEKQTRSYEECKQLTIWD